MRRLVELQLVITGNNVIFVAGNLRVSRPKLSVST